MLNRSFEFRQFAKLRKARTADFELRLTQVFDHLVSYAVKRNVPGDVAPHVALLFRQPTHGNHVVHQPLAGFVHDVDDLFELGVALVLCNHHVDLLIYGEV